MKTSEKTLSPEDAKIQKLEQRYLSKKVIWEGKTYVVTGVGVVDSASLDSLENNLQENEIILAEDKGKWKKRKSRKRRRKRR